MFGPPGDPKLENLGQASAGIAANCHVSGQVDRTPGRIRWVLGPIPTCVRASGVPDPSNFESGTSCCCAGGPGEADGASAWAIRKLLTEPVPESRPNPAGPDVWPEFSPQTCKAAPRAYIRPITLCCSTSVPRSSSFLGWPKFGQTRARVGRNSGQIWRRPGQFRLGLADIGRKFGRNRGQIGVCNVGRIQMSIQIWTKSGQIWSNSAKFGRCCVKFGHKAELGRLRVGFCRSQADVSRNRRSRRRPAPKNLHNPER